MKNIIFIVFFILLCIGCKSQSQKKSSSEDPLEVKSIIGEEGETVLLGFINLSNLNTLEFQSWFEPEYKNIKIPQGWAEEFAPLAKDLEFKLFLGTWCGDTQRELGGMFKLLDLMGVTDDKIEMYSISEAKDSPIEYEKEYDILYIPTLIFIENGREINRFVEFPVVNLDDDFSKILKRKNYENSYIDF